jgi:hypothetical protein
MNLLFVCAQCLVQKMMLRVGTQELGVFFCFVFECGGSGVANHRSWTEVSKKWDLCDVCE